MRPPVLPLQTDRQTADGVAWQVHCAEHAAGAPTALHGYGAARADAGEHEADEDQESVYYGWEGEGDFEGLSYLEGEFGLGGGVEWSGWWADGWVVSVQT